jgi:hypothetical protein
MPPKDLAARRAASIRALSIAYTYSEPVVFCEYVLDSRRPAAPRA